ncbi:MAG: PD-(D/E)XK nuclease family protein [Pseudomonadota bacterium]
MLDALAPWPTTPRPLDALIGDLLAAGRAVAGPGLWDKKAGRHAEAALARFARAAGGYGAVAPAAFPALLSAALEEAGDVREEAFRAHPQLKIWGPLEARAQCADLMILGGLNEGVWPRGAAIDPWLSRPMRARIGLPQPERRTGLSAHDFQQAASAPRVAMTRALKADGAPTTASRWLARLTTLLNGIGRGDDRGAALVAMRARGAEVLALAEAAADAPFGDLRPAPTPALRPAPRPPGAARPRRLYATDVEALIRDPYAVYAKRVLRLRRLDEPGLGADARLRGEALHAVAERFISATKDEWPAAGDAAALFDRLADETLAEIGAPAAATLAWSARLARIRDWFVASEAKRRAGAAPVGVELDGLTTIAAPAGLFEIRGRADRIDLLASGELAIYDYKAGGAPSERQVAVFAKQLPVLSVIAERGGFADAPAAPVRRTAYLSLSGAGAGGAERTIPPDEDAFAGLSALIASFDVEAQAYPPRAFPEAMSYASDYDHLSRYGEWSDREPET